MKRFSQPSTDRQIHTDATDFIPSTANTGGNNTLHAYKQYNIIIVAVLVPFPWEEFLCNVTHFGIDIQFITHLISYIIIIKNIANKFMYK